MSEDSNLVKVQMPEGTTGICIEGTALELDEDGVVVVTPEDAQLLVGSFGGSLLTAAPTPAPARTPLKPAGT